MVQFCISNRPKSSKSRDSEQIEDLTIRLFELAESLSNPPSDWDSDWCREKHPTVDQLVRDIQLWMLNAFSSAYLEEPVHTLNEGELVKAGLVCRCYPSLRIISQTLATLLGQTAHDDPWEDIVENAPGIWANFQLAQQNFRAYMKD